MKLEAKKYLYDIRQAVALLNEFTAGRSFADYERDAMLRSAVERKFEIIGEALSQLAKVDRATAARISGYQRVIAFRNVLITSMPKWMTGWYGAWSKLISLR